MMNKHRHFYGQVADQSTKLGIWSKIAILCASVLLFTSLGVILPMKSAKERNEREHGNCQQFRAEEISRVPARCVKELTL